MKTGTQEGRDSDNEQWLRPMHSVVCDQQTVIDLFSSALVGAFVQRLLTAVISSLFELSLISTPSHPPIK